MRLSIAIALALLLSTSLRAAAPKDLVKAELLADASTVKPGDTFTVGVMLHIKPQWHVYWTNPGDSGMATEVKIKVPNAKVGEVQFPIPKTFKQPGDIIGYGYEDEVMFTATIEVPENAKAGSSLDIAADASWLCCHDICVQGSEKLKGSVQVAAETKKQNDEQFDRWRNAMPKVLTQAVDVQNILQTTDQSTAPTKTKGQLKIAIAWNKSPSEMELYPPASPTASFNVDSIKTDGNRTNVVISFEAKSPDKSEKTAPQAILAYTSDAKRYGVLIPLEIDRPSLPESATKPTANAAEK